MSDLALDAAPAPAPRADEALGLRGRWYVVTPAVALGAAARAVTTCGETVGVWRERGALAWDRLELALAEADGYVWQWHGDGPPAGPPPELPSLRVPGTCWELGSVGVDAPWTDFVENTLDLVHPMFAHPWTHPTWWLHRLGVRPAFTTEVRMTATGWVAEAWIDLPRGRRWRLMWQELRLPDMVRLVVSPPRERPEAGVAAGAMEVIAHHPPEAAGRTRIEYAMGRRALPFERAGFRARPGGRWLHAQDREILEALAENRRRFPDGKEANVPIDAYTLLFRKLVAEAAAGRWDAGWASYPSPIRMRARI